VCGITDPRCGITATRRGASPPTSPSCRGCGTTSDADRAWAILFRQNNLRWPSTTARYQRVWTLKTYGRLAPPTCVAETVQRFGGFVAKYMGDGVLGDRGKRNGARKLARSGLDWLTEGP
jgi:hypothetical protein